MGLLAFASQQLIVCRDRAFYIIAIAEFSAKPVNL